MNTEDVRTLLAYNQWANQRLVRAAGTLQTQELTRDLGASFGSVKGTLVHILGGEWHWLRLFHGKPAGKLPAAEDFADAAALADAFPSLEREQREFVDSLTDDLLGGQRNVRGRDYTLAHLLQHVLNHSTYHRGQVSTLLRQLGYSPPATDFRVFLDERGSATPAGAA